MKGNHFAAFAQRSGPGWLAMVRYVQKGEAWPVMEGGRPKLFLTQDAAELAAHRRLTEHINGTIRTDRDEVRAKAEALFRPSIVRQRGSSKMVQVQRR